LFAGGGIAQAGPGHGHGNSAPAGHYPGPGGERIPYSNGYYMNDQHQRAAYTYPQDWQRYGHPQSWYQSHTHWNDSGHRDWYRGGNRH